ncbi:MAG: delta-60 repeat domain-containing protein, partial [Jatrophihabitans endophyticus]
MRERKRAAVRARLIVSAVAVAGLLLGGAAGLAAPATADTAPASGTPATVSADPLPTVQQNGVVYAQVTVGNVVYATGSFSETWPAGQTDQPGSNETARGNLLAYNITTGALVTGFAPGALNAQGLGIAASPDGKTIYVVGDFTKVGTAAANHIAAFNASTGALVTSFTASVSAEASAVAATSSAVYVGGNFFQAGGKARTRLAAFSPAGAL